MRRLRSFASFAALRSLRWSRANAPSVARRLASFWLVWSGLLLVHEAGHAASARRQGLAARRITVGVGPVLWRGQRGETQLVVRLVPLAGMTTLGGPHGGSPDRSAGRRPGGGAWREWAREVVVLAGGVLATLALAVAVAGITVAGERATGTRWLWGRYLVADAVVLTVFNFLPVPPLDGGRAALGAVAAWRGAPLPPDALVWVQLGGLALAAAPMTR
jgi:membrane-associated protease RseP (regulator of RpoE activity)